MVIDGHHRVIASMLEGVFPDCLVISPACYTVVIKKEQEILNLKPWENITKRNRSITNLPEEVLAILRNNTIIDKNISEEEKINYYKYYRSNNDKINFSFPNKYIDATKNMISKGFSWMDVN